MLPGEGRAFGYASAVTSFGLTHIIAQEMIALSVHPLVQYYTKGPSTEGSRTIDCPELR